MPTAVFALFVLTAAALYFMTPDERAKWARSALTAARDLIRTAIPPSSSTDPFDEFLAARTGRPVVTPLLLAANALVVALMLFDRRALDHAQMLIDWGGNVAPRTTNGEWWRLVAAMFVHDGVIHFAATMAGLVPLGLILERVVGRLTFAAVYLAAGTVASVVSLWTVSPATVSVGASGAVFGIYGLLLAVVACGVAARVSVPVPLDVVKRLAIAAIPFLLYNLVTDDLGTAGEMAGLATGFAGGLVVARGVTREKPGLGRAAMVTMATILIAIGGAVPLRGLIDVRPELARVVDVEERTTRAYDAAVARFTLGRAPASALVQLIERTILPDLQSVHARLNELHGVPSEHAALVAAAVEYCQLREASWRRRAEALRKSSTIMLRDADRAEQSALAAFERIRPSS